VCFACGCFLFCCSCFDRHLSKLANLVGNVYVVVVFNFRDISLVYNGSSAARSGYAVFACGAFVLGLG
jgi:hypothetical protein